MKNRKQSGFSLVELLVVISIILIIAAIAIPRLLAARQVALESSAVGSLKALFSAENLYSTKYPTVGFSATLAALGDGGVEPCTATIAASCLIDSVLASGTKSNYVFGYSPVTGSDGSNTGFSITATPAKTDGRYFFMDDSGVIRFNDGSAASIASTPIR